MLEKAMDHYAARQQRDVNTFRFLLDGQRVLEDQTPDDVSISNWFRVFLLLERPLEIWFARNCADVPAPQQLEMEDGDKIEAYTEQIGGGH